MDYNLSPSGRLASERVVIAAPMSFAGSAQRIWKITDQSSTGLRVALTVLAVVLISFAWSIIVVWYLMWGLLLVPYRLLRRGSRKEKRRALQHREQLTALATLNQQQTLQTALLIDGRRSEQAAGSVRVESHASTDVLPAPKPQSLPPPTA